jgi:hypothetical protein
MVVEPVLVTVKAASTAKLCPVPRVICRSSTAPLVRAAVG